MKVSKFSKISSHSRYKSLRQIMKESYKEALWVYVMLAPAYVFSGFRFNQHEDKLWVLALIVILIGVSSLLIYSLGVYLKNLLIVLLSPDV